MYFRRRVHTSPLRVRAKKVLTTIWKCLLLCIWPVLIGVAGSLAWYQWLFRADIHFEEKLEGIITAAWIPEFGILYSLLVAIAVNTVWTEYKSMRTAVKRYDLDTFIDLVDEDLSPLVHTMVLVASFAVLAGFLLLKYPGPWSGGILIFGVTFLLALMYIMILEIDDPCSGLWYIKSIPEEWLEIDAKEYRRKRCEESRAQYLKKNGHAKRDGEALMKVLQHG